MNHAEDARPEITHLVDAALDGTCTSLQAGRLQQLLTEDPAALAAYLDQVRMHALLQWRHGQVRPRVPAGLPQPIGGSLEQRMPSSRSPSPTSALRAANWRSWAAAAAVVLLGVALAAILVPRSRHGSSGTPSPMAAVAEVTEVRDVVWAADQSPLAVGAGVPPGGVAIQSGTLRFRSNAGAVVTLTGPARVQVVSAMRVRAVEGRITVRVGEEAHGFAVEAPGAEVIDLGTEFGVQVGAGGQTDVVVFEGEVDLTHQAPSSGGAPASRPAPTRMVKGQGLHVDPGGGISRVVAVERRPGEADWAVSGQGNAGAAVISSVRDNRRDPADPKYYQIVHHGLAEDAPAYVDRTYEWNGVDAAGLPPELLGADLVMTFNSDKRQPDLEVTVTLDRPAALYVFHEPRHGQVPDWLRRDFVDTGLTVGLDEGPPDMPQLKLGKGPGQSIDRVFRVWRREVREPGSVTLGENSAESKVMYGIAAAPLK